MGIDYEHVIGASGQRARNHRVGVIHQHAARFLVEEPPMPKLLRDDDTTDPFHIHGNVRLHIRASFLGKYCSITSNILPAGRQAAIWKTVSERIVPLPALAQGRRDDRPRIIAYQMHGVPPTTTGRDCRS